jgi:hypothetical protein
MKRNEELTDATAWRNLKNIPRKEASPKGHIMHDSVAMTCSKQVTDTENRLLAA